MEVSQKRYASLSFTEILTLMRASGVDPDTTHTGPFVVDRLYNGGVQDDDVVEISLSIFVKPQVLREFIDQAEPA